MGQNMENQKTPISQNKDRLRLVCNSPFMPFFRLKRAIREPQGGYALYQSTLDYYNKNWQRIEIDFSQMVVHVTGYRHSYHTIPLTFKEAC